MSGDNPLLRTPYSWTPTPDSENAKRRDALREEREGDMRQLFDSILQRINKKRSPEERIIILDRELGEAVADYCKTYGG